MQLLKIETTAHGYVDMAHKEYVHKFLVVIINMKQIRWKWCTPKLLDGLNCKSKGDNNEKRKSWGAFPSL
jgi:hypothetical protein